MHDIYWKNGATELSTGKKTLTLKMFENKYKETLKRLATKMEEINLLKTFEKHLKGSEEEEKVVQTMRTFDQLVNVNWPLAHFKSAVRYLQRDPEVILATGGTNWQKYLPPRFQKRIFFLTLWSEEEKENWGKSYIKGILEENINHSK